MNLLYLLFPFIVKYQETTPSEKHFQRIMMQRTDSAESLHTLHNSVKIINERFNLPRHGFNHISS